MRVAAVVAARRAVDASPDDPFLGLYLSDERIDDLLRNDRVWVAPNVAAEQVAAVEAEADRAAAEGAVLRLRALAAGFGLDALDVDILLAAMAPDVDDRFERYYGYLNDDVTRRRVSVGLALGLSGVAAADADGRRRFEAGGPLVASGLLDVEEPERPFLTRSLHVPDRVTAHVLGADDPDPVLDLLLVDVAATDEPPNEQLSTVLGETTALVYVHDLEAAAVQLAVDAGAAAGMAAVVVDLRRLAAPADAERVAAAAMREARLAGGVLIAGPVDELAEANAVAVQRLTASPGHLVLYGHRPWDPALVAPGAVRARRPSPHDGRAYPGLDGRARRPPRPGRRHRAGRRPVPPRRHRRSGAPPRRRRRSPASRDAPSPPTTSAAVPASRTRPGSSTSPGASTPTSAGTTSCCRRRSAVRCNASPTGPATASRCSASGGCAPAAGVARASRRCSPATPAPARR